MFSIHTLSFFSYYIFNVCNYDLLYLCKLSQNSQTKLLIRYEIQEIQKKYFKKFIFALTITKFCVLQNWSSKIGTNKIGLRILRQFLCFTFLYFYFYLFHLSRSILLLSSCKSKNFFSTYDLIFTMCCYYLYFLVYQFYLLIVPCIHISYYSISLNLIRSNYILTYCFIFSLASTPNQNIYYSLHTYLTPFISFLLL